MPYVSDIRHPMMRYNPDTMALELWDGTVLGDVAGPTGGLTDAQLRATPVPVEATLDTTGLATDTGQDTGNTSLASIDTKLTSQATGAKQDTGNTSLASLDSKITAVDTGDVTVSASALPTGAATSAKQDTAQTALDAIKTALEILDNVVSGAEAQVDVLTLPAITGTVTANQGGSWTLAANSGVDIGDVTVNNATLAVTQSGGWTVTANAGTGTFAVKELRAATPSQSTVADTASSTTLLASNANRLGATIANDSSAVLYVKLGATASATSYTARVAQYGLYEVPYGYTGVIDGIWASDPGDGAARITEFTA